MSRVIVAGGISIDATISLHRFPNPGEELGGRGLRFIPGGKGFNQAVAAARAGANVAIVGCIGDDTFSELIISALKREKIGITGIRQVAKSWTDMAFISVDPTGENTIVYDMDFAPNVSLDGVDSLLSRRDVLISDFAIPRNTIAELFKMGRRRESFNVLNAAPPGSLDFELIDLSDCIVINEFELTAYSGVANVDPADSARVEAAVACLQIPSEKAVIVTLGPIGLGIFWQGTSRWINARSVAAIDTTGAGDAFIGALGAEVCEGVSIFDAAAYANVAASIAVTRRGGGQSMPSREEVLSLLNRPDECAPYEPTKTDGPTG